MLPRLLFSIALAACLPFGASAQPATYYAGVVQHPTEHVAPVQVVARFTIPRMSGGINDFSGIATRDGETVLLLSDHGFITSARLRRGYGQQENSVQIQRVDPLLDEAGHVLHGSLQDAEGIALGRDGTIYVSFEQHNRVLAYPRLGGHAVALGEHTDFQRMRAGRAMEALAVARDGSLYAVPERPARATYGFPSYRLRDGEWTGSFRLPSEGTFLPVGADFGPDNQLYVLERTLENGRYRSQVRRFAINGRAISEPQVVMRSEPGQFDNLEGLAVYRDWGGRLHLLMVSDDDMNANLRSEIVDVVLNR